MFSSRSGELLAFLRYIPGPGFVGSAYIEGLDMDRWGQKKVDMKMHGSNQHEHSDKRDCFSGEKVMEYLTDTFLYSPSEQVSLSVLVLEVGVGDGDQRATDETMSLAEPAEAQRLRCCTTRPCVPRKTGHTAHLEKGFIP
jgi:hypothetical protein